MYNGWIETGYMLSLKKKNNNKENIKTSYFEKEKNLGPCSA
jgi:hypothetical protein